MKLLNLSRFFYSLFFLFFLIPNSFTEEEPVDIWKKTTTNQNSENQIKKEKITKNKISFKEKKSSKDNIQISEDFEKSSLEKPLYGIFDPEENSFDLYMWSKTDGNEIKSIFKRINKSKLSKSSEELLLNTIMTYAYLPEKNLSDKEFLDLKINWLIRNEKDNLLEQFLSKNIYKVANFKINCNSKNKAQIVEEIKKFYEKH